MGYILLLIIGGAVLIGLIVLFMGGRSRPAGRTAVGKEVMREQPSADEPSPAASSTASQAQANAAQRHTPPA